MGICRKWRPENALRQFGREEKRLSTVRPEVAHAAELAQEQQYVGGLYTRLDDLRARTVRRLEEQLAIVPHNPQAIGEREAQVELHTQRIVALDAAESGLCFGRLDRHDTEVPRYIGRIGLSSEDGAEEPLLVDWRAPAAQPFYTATPLHDLGVRRRRHIRTRGRTVDSIADETLDLTAPDVAERAGPASESVLLAALNATRTGRMTDIVRTIQAEQDRIIRSDARGVLVVQGGPGTGKTAVALHRAAYLLYTHRERLARSGLLVVGPTPTFLRYIADVLPALGETGVLLSGLGQLRPGLDARGPESPETAEVKGRLAMVDVLKAAIKDRETVPRGVRELVIDGVRIPLRPVDLTACRTTARRASRQHNLGRPAFVRALAELVAQRYADRIGGDVRGGADLLDRRDVEALRAEVVGEPAVRQLVDEMWPVLTPEGLLRDLLADPA